MMKIQFGRTYSIARHMRPKDQNHFTKNNSWNRFQSRFLVERKKNAKGNIKSVTISDVHLLVARIRHFFGIVSSFFSSFSRFIGPVETWILDFSPPYNDTNHFPSLACHILLSAFAFTRSPVQYLCRSTSAFDFCASSLCVINCESSLIYIARWRKTEQSKKKNFSFQWKRVLLCAVRVVVVVWVQVKGKIVIYCIVYTFAKWQLCARFASCIFLSWLAFDTDFDRAFMSALSLFRLFRIKL